MKKIFVFADWYAPGYKAGGPIRSCVNFADNMQGEYQVWVFTTDRDLNENAPYPAIRSDEWTTADNGVRIYYCSPTNLTRATIHRQLTEVSPDLIYLNSMFSARFTVLPLMIVRLSGIKAKIILSPRGMLRSSAIRFKSGKKKIFLSFFRAFGFHRRVHFLASDEMENADIHRYFGKTVAVTTIPNFPSTLPRSPEVTGKKSGELSMVYVGRVHPIKNTDYLIDVLAQVDAKVELTIVGSLEDKEFWQGCLEKISRLPPTIAVTYAGEMPNREVPAHVARHHIFVLPTKGENFGHAIFEALALGKPVLISDQTPWRNLETVLAGWDLPLDRPDLFRQAIEKAAAFSHEEYGVWSGAARRYAEDYHSKTDLKDGYRRLFH